MDPVCGDLPCDGGVIFLEIFSAVIGEAVELAGGGGSEEKRGELVLPHRIGG